MNRDCWGRFIHSWEVIFDRILENFDVIDPKSYLFISLIIRRLYSVTLSWHEKSFLEPNILNWWGCWCNIFIHDISFLLSKHNLALFWVVLAWCYSVHSKDRGLDVSRNNSCTSIDNLIVMLVKDWSGFRWYILRFYFLGNSSSLTGSMIAQICHGNSTWAFLLYIGRDILPICAMMGWFWLNHRQLGWGSHSFNGEKFLANL